MQQPGQVCDKIRQVAAAAVWAFPDHEIWNSIRASNSLSFWQVQRKEGFNKDQETPKAKAETTIDFKALETWLDLQAGDTDSSPWDMNLSSCSACVSYADLPLGLSCGLSGPQ